ncbi:hypothetical protein BH23PLA1_BH23PLA1_25320 [soil metagenome]
MRSYQTEIRIPADRYLHLRLPDQLPEGKAVLIVEMVDPAPTDPETIPDAELGPFDPEEFEWWEEFDHREDP